MLWKQFVAWYCNGYSATPISDYINNPIFQELPLKQDCFGNGSDERVYINLQDSLGYTKNPAEMTEN